MFSIEEGLAAVGRVEQGERIFLQWMGFFSL
jgi:hypothetical protein